MHNGDEGASLPLSPLTSPQYYLFQWPMHELYRLLLNHCKAATWTLWIFYLEMELKPQFFSIHQYMFYMYYMDERVIIFVK